MPNLKTLQKPFTRHTTMASRTFSPEPIKTLVLKACVWFSTLYVLLGMGLRIFQVDASFFFCIPISHVCTNVGDGVSLFLFHGVVRRFPYGNDGSGRKEFHSCDRRWRRISTARACLTR